MMVAVERALCAQRACQFIDHFEAVRVTARRFVRDKNVCALIDQFEKIAWKNRAVMFARQAAAP